MKHLRIASDLHLEGFSNRNPETLAIDFLPRDDRDADSMLILAGDISSSPSQLVSFLQVCQSRFERVLFIPGNHEYYRHDYLAWNAEMAERFLQYCPGLIFANGGIGYVEIENVRFIYGTLWGDGGLTIADQGAVGWYLNDFRLISHGEHPEHGSRLKFTVQNMIDVHRSQKATIDEYLRMAYVGKTVVITHHLPSRRLVSARFWPKDGSDGANGGFVGDCDNILASDHAPNLWIHGHTHDTIDTRLWRTRIVCNPAGYRGEWMSTVNTFMRPNAQGGRDVVPIFVRLSDLEADPSPVETT